jgi:hypothetical protein
LLLCSGQLHRTKKCYTEAAPSQAMISKVMFRHRVIGLG